MRLWHQLLISKLPRAQLLGQHRELCALRGNGWGKHHSVVNYVFIYPYSFLYYFHLIVIMEMEKRGFMVDSTWKNMCYRGRTLGYDYSDFTDDIVPIQDIIYFEHDYNYFKECLNNLASKGIYIDNIK